VGKITLNVRLIRATAESTEVGEEKATKRSNSKEVGRERKGRKGKEVCKPNNKKGGRQLRRVQKIKESSWGKKEKVR